MKSKSEELNWRRQPEPHLTLHPEDNHGILEPNVDPVAQRSQKKADASVLRNVALCFCSQSLICGIYRVLAKSSSSDEIMQNEHPRRGQRFHHKPDCWGCHTVRTINCAFALWRSKKKKNCDEAHIILEDIVLVGRNQRLKPPVRRNCNHGSRVTD